MSALVNGRVRAVVCEGLRRAALSDWTIDEAPLRPDEVFGRTLVSLISPGTELNSNFDTPGHDPCVGGYAAVMEIERVGDDVTEFKPGQRVFCMGNHCTHQRQPSSNIVALPEGLAPEIAVFARLAGVSWTTLVTTTARPADRVLVVGLGIVGNLAAQAFQSAGYRVTAVDPVAARQEFARRAGLRDVRGHVPADDPAICDQVALAVDCSGHERAVLDALRVVRKGGEVVLVGVPWQKRSDLPAFDVLHAVFHRYVHLRSGWEWELPRQPGHFQPRSIFGGFAAALDWLADGRLRVADLLRVVSPIDAQDAYQSLLEQRGDSLSVVFDWRAVQV